MSATGEDLRTLLVDLVSAPGAANPALTILIDDYATFHLVLVVVGGAFAVASTAGTVIAWRRLGRARRAHARFEAFVYGCFGVLGAGLSAFLALVVAANVSNAANPRGGFTGSLGLLVSPRPGTARAARYEAFADWLHSASPVVPPIVQAAIDDRLSWQRPKAVACVVLLGVAVTAGAWIWRTLVRRSRVRRLTRPGDIALLGAGVAATLAGIVLLLMVIGNVQASIAPIAMTLFYG